MSGAAIRDEDTRASKFPNFRVHYEPGVGCYHVGAPIENWGDEYLVWLYWVNRAQLEEFVARYGRKEAELRFTMDGKKWWKDNPMEDLEAELVARGISAHVKDSWEEKS